MKVSSGMSSVLKRSDLSTTAKSKKSRNIISYHYASQERQDMNRSVDTTLLGGKSPYQNDRSLFLPNMSFGTPLNHGKETYTALGFSRERSHG